MKRLISSIAVASIMLMPVSALAVAQTPQANQANQVNITRLQNLANTEIDKRVTTLNGLVAIVNGATHLTADDRANLLTQITPELTALPVLKTKIDGDTDLATVKTDIQSIVTEFRVYRLLVPKVHLVRVADRLTDASNNLTVYADKLQAHIDKAKTDGKDVTNLTTTMTDMRVQIATAQSDAAGAVSSIINVTPDQYNVDTSITSSTRSTLNAGRLAAAAALKDGNSIRSDVESLGQ